MCSTYMMDIETTKKVNNGNFTPHVCGVSKWTIVNENWLFANLPFVINKVFMCLFCISSHMTWRRFSKFELNDDAICDNPAYFSRRDSQRRQVYCKFCIHCLSKHLYLNTRRRRFKVFTASPWGHPRRKVIHVCVNVICICYNLRGSPTKQKRVNLLVYIYARGKRSCCVNPLDVKLLPRRCGGAPFLVFLLITDATSDVGKNATVCVLCIYVYAICS